MKLAKYDMASSSNQTASAPLSRDARLLGYVRRHRLGWFANVVLSFAAGAAVMLQPWPMQVLVDHVLGDQPMPPWLADVAADWPRATLLLIVGLATLAIYALAALLDAASAYCLVRLGQTTVFEVARELFSHVQRQALRFFTRHSLGDLLARLTGDSWCVYKAVDALLITAGRALVVSIGMAVVLWRENITLTLIALAAAPVLGLAAFAIRHRTTAVMRQRRNIEGQIQSHVQQTLRGIHVVQAFAREEHEHGRFQRFAVEVIRAQQQGLFLRNLSTLWSGLTRTVGIGLILYFGAQQVLAGDLTAGKLWVFLIYLRSMLMQFETMVTAYMTMREVRAERDRVCEIFEHAPEVRDAPDAIDARRLTGHVQIDRVTFGYEESQPILREVSIEARAGQTVAIVGATGAGKSTLVNLLPRFFDPWAGAVRIDGRDVRQFTVRSLRRNVAMVLQEPYLFPLTIAQNIAYGDPSADRQKIIDAAVAANADAFIRALPEGYDTLIGERGATLSGGERQRLAIARALLKDAPILILDEPTSALDTQTEHAVMQALERLMEGRTTFVIAHRLTTVRRADEIVVLEHGRVLERGTHAQLLARSGHYARLCELQFASPHAKGGGT